MKNTELLPIQSDNLKEILERYENIWGKARTSLEDAIRIGELLTLEKASMKHGEWLPWVKANLPFDHQTASRWMGLYGHQDQISHNGKCELTDAYKMLTAGGKEKTAHVSHNSGDNEWYTPTEFVEAAREVMGGIDCDPASSEIANRTVKAKKYFDKEQDGLKQKWGKRVFMNPPYASPLVAQFAEAVASKFEDKEIEQAIVLVNNATETSWFARIAGQASAICFPAARIKFTDPTGKPGAPLQGQAVLYLGDRHKEFFVAFKPFGILCRVIH